MLMWVSPARSAAVAARCDTALALDVVAVHHPLGNVLIGGKRPCLD
jgi:hypothetical protein